jgi:hypothetical protein
MKEQNRRQFISNVAKAGLGVSALAYPPNIIANEITGKAKHIIYIYMDGGMSHIDTFDPKDNKETGGKFSKIPTSADGVYISEHLKGLSKHMDKAAIVRSMTVTTGDHEGAQYNGRTSYKQISTIVHPTLGAWMARFNKTGSSLPSNVLISGPAKHPGSGWMPKVYSPVPVIDPTKGLQYSDIKDVNIFKSRWEILNKLNKNINENATSPEIRAYVEFYDETIKLLQSEDLAAFDISKEDNNLREVKYGNNRFGQGLLLARRLIENGVSFVEVKSGGWDTHVNNFDALETSLPQHDQAITALIEDLDSRGLLSSTLIVIATEFGRTPIINVNDGRDHWPSAFSCTLIGAGIKGGTVFGSTDEKGAIVSEGSRKIDPKDFNATIAKIAGLPFSEEFHSPNGRPFKIASDGKPIDEIIG